MCRTPNPGTTVSLPGASSRPSRRNRPIAIVLPITGRTPSHDTLAPTTGFPLLVDDEAVERSARHGSDLDLALLPRSDLGRSSLGRDSLAEHLDRVGARGESLTANRPVGLVLGLLGREPDRVGCNVHLRRAGAGRERLAKANEEAPGSDELHVAALSLARRGERDRQAPGLDAVRRVHDGGYGLPQCDPANLEPPALVADGARTEGPDPGDLAVEDVPLVGLAARRQGLLRFHDGDDRTGRRTALAVADLPLENSTDLEANLDAASRRTHGDHHLARDASIAGGHQVHRLPDRDTPDLEFALGVGTGSAAQVVGGEGTVDPSADARPRDRGSRRILHDATLQAALDRLSRSGAWSRARLRLQVRPTALPSLWARRRRKRESRDNEGTGAGGPFDRV